jgi:hypothetical protein
MAEVILGDFGDARLKRGAHFWSPGCCLRSRLEVCGSGASGWIEQERSA